MCVFTLGAWLRVDEVARYVDRRLGARKAMEPSEGGPLREQYSNYTTNKLFDNRKYRIIYCNDIRPKPKLYMAK